MSDKTVVLATCTISRNRSIIIHVLLTYRRTRAICSFIEISRKSSTNIEKNPLSRSLMMTLNVSRANAFTMSFWISWQVSLQFFRAFCNASLIDSLWSAKNCKNSRKFPLSLDLEIYRDHEKLTPDIKGILCNQLLHLIKSDIQLYLDLIA